MSEGGRCAAGQIRGKRSRQEDDYGFLDARALGTDRNEHSLLLVADGMGGHVGGATASGLLRKTFVEAYPDASGPIVHRLQGCLQSANAAMADAVDQNPELAGMGSTLVAAVVSEPGPELDQRRGFSVVVVPQGRAGAVERRPLHGTGPRRPRFHRADDRRGSRPGSQTGIRCRSAVTGEDIHLVDISPQPVPVEKGDRLLLASDGLMTLGDREIAGILAETQNAPLEEGAAALIEAVEAADNPRQDNTTLLLYAPAEGTEPPGADEAEPEADQGIPRLKRLARLFGRAAGRKQ